MLELWQRSIHGNDLFKSGEDNSRATKSIRSVHCGAAISSYDWLCGDVRRYALISIVPPPASTIRSPFPPWYRSQRHSSSKVNKVHLDGIVYKATLNTEMQASFALSDEGEITIVRTLETFRYQACLYSSCAYHALLSTFPAIRVSENKLCTIFQGTPQFYTIRVRLFYESASTMIEVS